MTADDVTRLVLGPPADAGLAVARWTAKLERWVPGCRVEEVGSTGVEGLPTKGDLDLAVLALEQVTWLSAVRLLSQHLMPYEPQNWSETWASFQGDSGGEEVGVQLVLVGSDEDNFLHGFRALLLRDAAVVARYAALKASHDGHSMADYRAAKGRFVEDALRVQAGPRDRWRNS